MTCGKSLEDFVFSRAHTIGERLFFGVTTEEEEDLTEVPISVFLDAPDGSQRHTFRYLNDGTDGLLSGDGKTITFEKSAEWSAANMTAGFWRVRFARGVSASQTVILDAELNVIEPAYGALEA